MAESLEACGFGIRAQIVWAKDRLVLGRGHYHWQHEPCWYAVRGEGHWSGDRKQTTLWRIAGRARTPRRARHAEAGGVHAPADGEQLLAGPGGLRAFCGSGTTIIAAEMSGRACHAIELSPAYVDVAVKRWQDFTGQQAVLEGDGRPFHEIEEARRAAAAV